MHPASSVITSSNIADAPVMAEIHNSRGLMIIRDASYKHYLTIHVSLLLEEFNKNMRNIHVIFTFMCFCFHL